LARRITIASQRAGVSAKLASRIWSFWPEPRGHNFRRDAGTRLSGSVERGNIKITAKIRKREAELEKGFLFRAIRRLERPP